MWSALKYKRFAYLFGALLASEAAHRFYRIALLVMVYTLTENALWVSATLAAQLLASVLLGPMLSAWADARDRKGLLAGAVLVKGGVVLAVLLLGMRLPLLLLALVFLLEGARSLYRAVVHAVVPELVPEKHMDAANGLVVFSGRFAETVFVGLAGVLVAWGGAELAFGSSAALYLLAMLLLAGLPSLPSTRPAQGGYFQRVREGVGHVLTHPTVRQVVGTLFAAAMFGSVETVLGVVLAVGVLGVGSAGFGLMEGAMALGAILGTFIIPHLTNRLPRERVFFGALIVFGLFEASIGAFPLFAWVLAAYFVSGLLNVAFLIPARTMLQLNTPNELRTRVFAAFAAVMDTAVLIGVTAGGALEKGFGAPTTFVIAGLSVSTVALIAAVFARRATLPAPSVPPPGRSTSESPERPRGEDP
ncbi:MFS transporter [Marinithermus hydrothermalis]|uniref:Major facilitator superfamily MFS_1 n=1 Tax=Marinithermus hydrothermalis (strain DSM 14884 / JCM 11576 / T1) TaxID=869210 RepID=F2NNZ2_MARHT|nr:MFS transporter [Marinithermus hydrothermalis]AEB11580.1 major facilitator superfamily MFS_1 [Marinithermus hydrothermalis DSM 14884]